MATVPLNMQRVQNQINQLLNEIGKLYPYDIVVLRDESRQNDIYQVRYTDSQGNSFKEEFAVEDEVYLRLHETDLVRTVAEGVFEACEEVTRNAGESSTGKYPFHRLWADRHLSGLPKLFGWPKRDIPGWVFDKFNKNNTQYPGAKNTGKPPALPQANIDPNGHEQTPLIDYDVKEFDMAAATKKKRVVTKPKKLIDPSKVKKPLCRIHETEMEYDAVDAKWKCKEPDCGMVARPKRDADDRSLVLGKGGLQLRLIQQGTKTTVVLISDDNVALDVTKIVDIESIIRDFDAVSQAQVASENGKDSFNINVEKSVEFSGLKLTVMGADDLSIMEA